MRQALNRERIEGRVYQHDLTFKTVQNQASANYGKEFISGNIEVAVDENGLNVIPIHFTYVVEENKNGSKNATYAALKTIIEKNNTWVKVGKDEATKVRIDTAIALNDFYTQNDELVSTKTNEGGFVTIVNELGPENERNKFEADMVITSVKRVEKNPEKNINEDYATVRGAIFNFRNAILPIEFTIRQEKGIEYFEQLEATPSNPIYTKVWGKIDCLTISKVIEEESAFGEPSVRTTERKVKDWTITGTAKVPYDFGDEAVLTQAELVKASQDREVMLAEIKKRRDEYVASKNTTISVFTAPKPVVANSAPFTF